MKKLGWDKFSKRVLNIVLRDLNRFIHTDLRNKSTIWESDKATSEEEVEEEGEVVARHNHNLSEIHWKLELTISEIRFLEAIALFPSMLKMLKFYLHATDAGRGTRFSLTRDPSSQRNNCCLANSTWWSIILDFPLHKIVLYDFYWWYRLSRKWNRLIILSIVS